MKSQVEKGESVVQKVGISMGGSKNLLHLLYLSQNLYICKMNLVLNIDYLYFLKFESGS